VNTFVNPYIRYEGDMVTVTIGKDKSRESVAGTLACDGEYLVVGDRRIKWDAVHWIRSHAPVVRSEAV